MRYAFATHHERDAGTASMLNAFGHKEDSVRPDFLVYTGGADVGASMYLSSEEECNPWNVYATRVSATSYICDKAGWAAFITSDLPMLGICRGAQFLNVCAGFKLHRHILGHGVHGTHKIDLQGKGILDVTSTHHQCMSGEPYKYTEWDRLVLGSAGPVDEIVLFNDGKRNLLCIQGHPEYCSSDHEFALWTSAAINNYLIKGDN